MTPFKPKLLMALHLFGGCVFLTTFAGSAQAAIPHIFEVTKEVSPGELAAITGDQFGTAPEVWIDRIENSSDTPDPELRVMELVSVSNQHITVSIPGWLSAGLYAIFVRNASGTSAPAWINRAEAWSTLDLAGAEVNSTQPFRLYGWNLSKDAATPTVRLVDTQSSASFPLIAISKLNNPDGSSLNPYTLRVSLAGVQGLQAGRQYDVYVSNGFGGTYGEVRGPRITYVSQSAPWNLPPWAHRFNGAVAKVFNVKDEPYNLAPSDRDAIQNAINDAAAWDPSGAKTGAVVRLPTGTYDVGSGVVLKSKVILLGDPPTNGVLGSIIRGDATGLSVVGLPPTSTVRETLIGLKDLKIESAANGPDWAVDLRKVDYLFIEGCHISNVNVASFHPNNVRPRGGSLITQESRYVAVRGNWVEQIAESMFPHFNAIDFRLSRDLWASNNLFYFYRGRLDATEIDDLQFEGNRVRHKTGGVADLKNGPFSRGVFYHGTNVAVLGNSVSKPGVAPVPEPVAGPEPALALNPEPYPDSGDGEAFVIDGSGNGAYGVVTSAGPATLTDSNPEWVANRLVDPTTGPWTVTIVRGKGMGQVRRLQAATATTLSLAEPWTLVPDSTSAYALANHSERILVYGNSVNEQTVGGISTFGATVHDYIVAANTLRNAGGIQVTTMNLNTTATPTAPAYKFYTVATNVMVQGNSIVRTLDRANPATPDVPLSRIFIHNTGVVPSVGTGIFGPVVRNNTLQLASPNFLDSLDGEAFVVQGNRGVDDTTAPSILGAILEKNHTKGVDVPYLLNQGAVQTVIRPGNGARYATLIKETGRLKSIRTVVDDTVFSAPLDAVVSGRTPDRSIFGAPATLHGDTTSAGGAGLGFDGAGDYVGVPYAPQFANLHSYTVAAWVRVNTKVGSQTILSTRHRPGGDGTFDLKVVQNTIWADVGDGSHWIQTGLTIGPDDVGSNGEGGNITANVWHHVAYVIDNDAKTFRLYLNGDLKRTVPFSATLVPLFMQPGGTLTLGSVNLGEHENLSGRLDNVVVLNRAINSAEVVKIMNDRALYMPFDVATGITSDTSRHGTSGILRGNTSSLAGVKREGLAFDGDGDYVEVPYGPQFENLRSFTVAAWVRVNTKVGSQTILSTRHGDWRDGTFDLKVVGNSIYADVGDGSNWIQTGLTIGPNDTGSNGQGGNIDPNVWQHVAYVIDDDSKAFRLYLNGDLKRTVAFSSTSTPLFMAPRNTMTLGSVNRGVHENLNGRIDDVVVIGRAITSAQVAELLDDTALHMPLDVVTQTPAPPTTADISRHGARGTLRGNVSFAGVPGVKGAAIAFDGSNGTYLDVPYGPQFENLHSFTVAAWVRLNAKGGSQTILSTRTGGAGATFDFKVHLNTITGDIGDGTNWIHNGLTIGPDKGGDIAANVWHHVAYVIDNDAKRCFLYLDGALKQEVEIPLGKTPLFMTAPDPSRPGSTLTLGSVDTGVHENLNGRLDDVIVLQRAISSAEVAALARP